MDIHTDTNTCTTTGLAVYRGGGGGGKAKRITVPIHIIYIYRIIDNNSHIQYTSIMARVFRAGRRGVVRDFGASRPPPPTGLEGGGPP